MHGDNIAADTALAFCAQLNRLLPDGAEDIKMLGDACLVRADQAAHAVWLGSALVGWAEARHGIPGVRIGLHTGSAGAIGSGARSTSPRASTSSPRQARSC